MILIYKTKHGKPLIKDIKITKEYNKAYKITEKLNKQNKDTKIKWVIKRDPIKEE